MIPTLLLALVVPLAPEPGELGGTWFSKDVLIRIWADRTQGLRAGERVRLYARAEADGYLLVLHAEPGGRVRVLFPLDPSDDNYLRGGTSYELRGRGGREALEIFDRSGQGTVLAAFSRDPFRFDPFVRSDHWDYLESGTWIVSGDPEGHLLNLVDRVATGRYDYDVLRYEVIDYLTYRDRPVRLSLYGAYYRDHHHGGLHLSIHLGYPWLYYHPYYYPVYFYPYPVYYHPQPVFVAYWYDPFFAGFFAWYRPVPYVVYYPYPRYYAYYATYYPAYRYRSAPGRLGAGVYTFKGGVAPPVIEPHRRPALTEAVARRLAAPENFSSAVRRTVVAERTVPQAAGELARRRPGGVAPPGGTLRRLVPEYRERSGVQREELGPAPAQRGELRDRAIRQERPEAKEPLPEGDVGLGPVPGRERPSDREWRLRVAPEREPERAVEPGRGVAPYRAVRPAVPRPGAVQQWPRAAQASSGEMRRSLQAAAALSGSVPRLVVPPVHPSQRARPPAGGGRRRP